MGRTTEAGRDALALLETLDDAERDKLAGVLLAVASRLLSTKPAQPDRVRRLTIAELVDRGLVKSARAGRRLVKEGVLVAERVGRNLLFREEAVEAFLAAREVKPRQRPALSTEDADLLRGVAVEVRR